MIDKKGVERKTGEQWLIRESGTYLPLVYELVLEVAQPYTLNES